jgi:hypothetical protein
MAMAHDWHQLVSEEGDGGFDQWKEMRAQFFELWMHHPLTCFLLEQKRVRVVSSAEAHGRQLLRDHGVDESALQLSDLGCLRTDYNIGLQEIHSDVQQHRHAAICYFVIVYLHATESTAVANVRADEVDAVWSMAIPEAKERFQSVEFVTERVSTGDALVMRGTTFHYGIGNPDKRRRYVGFLSFTPKHLPLFDSQEQFYPTGIRDGSKY